MSTSRKTVFVDGRCHLRLRLLSAVTGRPAGELVAEAVEAHYAPILVETRAAVTPPVSLPAAPPGRPPASPASQRGRRKAR